MPLIEDERNLIWLTLSIVRLIATELSLGGPQSKRRQGPVPTGANKTLLVN